MSMSIIGLPRIQNDYRSSRTRPVKTEHADLWTMLEDSSLSQGYRHLTLTLLANGPECSKIREEMDSYVLAELKGKVVHRTFPEQWLHIQACHKCREFHDLIHFITRETLPVEDGWEAVPSTTRPI